MSENQRMEIRSGYVNFDEVQSNANDGKKIPTFDVVAYTGEAMVQAFSMYPVVVDLDGVDIPDRDIPIRLEHDNRSGVGHADRVQVDANGGKPQLVASGFISRDTEAARDVAGSARNGFPWQASIKGPAYSVEEVLEGSVEVNGRSFDAPLNVVRKMRLSEISFVDLGADDNTRATVAASSKLENPDGTGATMADEKDKKGSEPTKEVEASGDKKVEKNVEASGVLGELEDMKNRGESEMKRQTQIKAHAESVAGDRPELGSIVGQQAIEAIEAGTSASDFGLQMIRYNRDLPGVGGPRGDRGPSGERIEAALGRAGGLSGDELIELGMKEEVVEASEREFGQGGLGIAGVVLEAAQANGFTGRSIESNLRGALECAMNTVQAGASTVSLPNILSNVANKFARVAFMHVENSYEKITYFGTSKDFKEKQTNTLTGDLTLKELGKSGEIEHGKPGEETYGNKVKTFARQINISRTDLINDDTNALSTMARRLGRGAALAHRQEFWSAFLADSSHFTDGASNGVANLITPALDVTGLTAAFVAHAALTDPDGEKLGSKPKYLLVPTELEYTAKQLINSSEIRDPSSSSAFGISNPHQGTLEVVVSQYLSNATAWYVLADPNDLPTIETSFLNGNRVPTLETAAADWDNLGIRMRSWYDFGSRLQEKRGGIKSSGTT